MTDRFAERMEDRQVRGDTRIVAGLAAIYCAAKHRSCERHSLVSDAGVLGVYGRKVPVLCDDCAGHIRYAERRRALCKKDPKPFCSNCDTHCYEPNEAVWQREMMRFAGPRSVFRGYAIPAVKHALEAWKWHRSKRREATGGSAS